MSIINKRILEFDYFIIDKDDKPNAINENHITNGSFPLSAGQMTTLILNLPLILGDLFNLFDENWLNFINLNQIFNLIFCFFYDQLTIEQLNNKVSEYLENYCKLYPSASVTPKMHFLTHLTDQMENFGPLRHQACLRFEAKNGLIKRLDYTNFKNICFTASEKHQFWMSSKELEQKNKKSLKYIDDICLIDKNKVPETFFYTDLKVGSSITICKYLKKDGFKFFPESFLILNFDLSVGMKSVGKIKEILEINGEYFFYLQIYMIDKIYKNLNCLQISSELNYVYIKYENLNYKHVQFAKYILDSLILQVRYFHHLIF